MPVDTFNGDVVLPHPPDWRQTIEWSRSWDTRIESAATGAECRIGLRLKPRQRIRYRIVPLDLRERIALVARLLASLRTGRALVPHWGRGAALAGPASGTTIPLDASSFPVQPEDVLFLGRVEPELWDAWELAEVASVDAETNIIHLIRPLAASFEVGARVYPTIAGEIRLGELEAIEDWRQAVSVEVRQLRTVPIKVPVIVDPEPEPLGSDYWLWGAPVPRFSAARTFDTWLDGAPVLQP